MERTEITPWFYYDVFNNGKRIIHVPSPELKKVQRFILRKYFKPYWTSKSVKETALVHCNKKWLMKLDIKDFFNFMTEEQIKGVINKYVQLSCPNNYLSNDNKEGLSDTEQIFAICTINGKLPTGSPTSPYIANLFMADFDDNIEKFCYQYGVNYSRYMDDLFFSTNREQYILSLTELEVLKYFKEFGFEMNVSKIKYISSNKRQKILGLGVNNQKPVLTKDDKRKYRSYFYNILYPIQFNKIKTYEDHESEVLGHLAYIKSVDKEYYNKVVKYVLNLMKRLKIEQKPCLRKLFKVILAL